MYRLACLLLAAALAVGCAKAAGGTPTPTPTLPPPTALPITPAPSLTSEPLSTLQGTVSVWVPWEADRVADLTAILQTFQQLNPRVEIRLSYVRAAELLGTFRAAVEAGQGPTVLIGSSEWGPALLRDGTIVDVSTRVLPSQREGIVPRLWSQVSSGGSVLGFPVRERGVVLYRNRSLAAQPVADLEALLRQAAATSARFAAEPVFDLGFNFSSSQLTPCGGTVLRAGGGLGFDRDAGICWLKLLARFRQAGPVTFNSDADRSTFMAGHSPWLIDTADALPEIVSKLGAENVAVDPWPTIGEGNTALSGTVWTDNAYFAAGSSAADLEASWAFVSFLVSPEGQQRLAQAAGSWFLPVARSVQPLDPLAVNASGLLAESTALPLAANLDVYRVPLERAVVAVAGQAADPTEALQRAVEVITHQLTQSPPGG